MPDFPIVDSHVHLWDPSHFRIGWLDNAPRLNHPFLLKEYAEHTAGIQVEAMVYLEVDINPSYRLLEAQWVNALAAQDPRIQGIVASAPLEDGDQVRPFLEALVATGPRVKGVRRLLQGESVEFCLQPRFIRGVQLLAGYGLSFDLCIYHPHLANAIKLVEQCPNTSIILDHIAKPGIKQGLREPWMTQIAELAALPNIICKVSGATTEADWEHWTIDDVRPYVERVLEVFGEDRVVYGGDWPVVLNASSYRRWVDTLDTITAHLSPAAKRKLWAENAKRFYRLEGAR